jgi:Holliday junction resolvase
MAKRGKLFEKQVHETLTKYGYEAISEKSVRLYEGFRPWKTDFVASKNNKLVVMEVKEQHSDGSTRDKLDGSFRKLRKISKQFNAEGAVFVYSGKKLTEYIETHPFVQEILADYPDITPMSFSEMENRLAKTGSLI